jgi:hypothetical protein
MSFSRRGGARREQRGSVLMIVLILMALLAVIPIGMQLVTTNNNNSHNQLNAVGQANNMARAGLLDAMSWFRRQPNIVSSLANPTLYSYPDQAFAPQYSTNTAQSDTMDSSIGIVEQYQIDSNNTLWGRYEVHIATQGYQSDPNSVHDISALRIPGQQAGAGLAWYLASTGYVFRNVNPAVPFNQSPNQIVGTAKVVTEIRRVSLILPLQAAVIVGGPNVAVTATNNGRILGGNNVGIGYYGSTTSGISISGTGSSVTGAPASESISTGTVNVPNPYTIFGMSGHDLSILADYNVTSVSQLPTTYPSQAVVYINGSASFTASGSMTGGGILYVTSTLTEGNSVGALFGGVIYSGGAVTVDGPALINGAIVSNGAVTVNGDGDAAVVQYSASTVSSVQQQAAQYRESRSEYYTFTTYK